MKRRRFFLLFIIVALSSPNVTSATLLGYLGTGYGTVYHTNFDTGEQSEVKHSAQGQMVALDISPIDGMIYTSGGGKLYRIDPISGQDESIGNLSNVESLSFDYDGTLYGIQQDKLIIIDPDTADWVLVGQLAPYYSSRALAINQSGRALGCIRGDPSVFFEINLSDGSTTALGELSRGDWDAFDFGPDNELYAWTGEWIYHIDIDNLIDTHVGLTHYSFSGEAFALIPEPTTVIFLGLGVLILARKRGFLFIFR